MRTIFRWLFRIFLVLLVVAILLVVGVLLLKDTLAKSFTEKSLRDGTGMDARIAKLEVGLLTPTVNLEGLKIYNTPQFGGGTFFEMPELRIEYVANELRNGKLHLKTVRLNIAELHVIKDKNGRTNFDELEKATKPKKRGPKDKPVNGSEEFGGIDTLYLTVGKIRITDLANPRNNMVLNIGLKDEVGRNLKTAEDIRNWGGLTLLKVALQQRMMNPGAGNLGDLLQDFFAPKPAKKR